MGADRTDDSSPTGALAPKTITDRFSGLEIDDLVYVNDRETPYEVVDTDTYSVTARDPDGNRVTFSQNLQSGGWVVHEGVWHVESPDG